MLKFIRGKGQQPSAERQKLQRELFAFRKTVQHGFPNKPTALDWDPLLRLLALGTATGAIKVIGKPGVEFYGQHTNHETAVTRLVFIPNEGRIVSLCDDNSLHLWEINGSSLEEVKSQSLEGKLKRISAMCLESSGEHLLLGTEGGNIYLLNLKSFQMSDTIIYQDIVMQNVPEGYKINPGAVESISEQPGCPDKILIGYNRGLMVLWNRKSPGAEQTYICTQQLESICWHKSGLRFASSHNDGSYALWDVSVGDKSSEEPITLYGPFPCKAVTKLLWLHAKKDDFIIFSGGMPRASYSDRYTITVQQGEKHVVFDFTSRVIDFFVISALQEDKEFDEPDTLIVLLEEELLAIDLLSDDWRLICLPYLVSLHASAVTCSQHVSDVPEDIWNSIVDAGKLQAQEQYSEREWPINGGNIFESEEENKEKRRELLLTGHEDGTVRFWNASDVALQPMYKFSSSHLFTSDEIGHDGVNGPSGDEDDEEWPPFRKVGSFDPYSDDPRLAVKKIALCPLSGTLAIAGTAGSVIVAKLESEEQNAEIKISTMNIVLDRDGFVWKGHDELAVRGSAVALQPGFQPSAILQLHPPAAVTALALHSDWGLVAAGTAHGLALFDFINHKGVLTKCTLNPNDLSGAGDAPISRRKSFKKSLRESFRRLRKGRSTRRTDKRGGSSPSTEKKSDAEGPTPSSAPLSPTEAKPVERQVEARPVDDSLGSMVRCLYFTKTFIVNATSLTATLWAGSNNGTVYVFTVIVPNSQKRVTENVTCQLGKEIQLKHRAPVIAVAVLDGASIPLPEPLEIERGIRKVPDTSGPHRVIICSEEQFKIFTLPSLKPFCKFKLTAHEGARVRRMGLAQFCTSRPNSSLNYSEICIVSLTNIGDCIVLSVPDLRRQLNAAVIRKEDINGISSLSFTRYGEALYLHSSSELQRITLSAAVHLQPHCSVDLPEGVRESDKDQETEEEEMNDEGEIEGRESVAPSPTGQEQQSIPPTVNGEVGHGDKDDAVVKLDETKEGGEDEEKNDISAFSIGDITIDSVKDHLLTSSTIEENRGAEIKTDRIELSTRTSETQSVVVKTTVISSCETTVINSSDIAVVDPPLADGQPATHTFEINLRKAPLAKMEDIEMENTQEM